MFVAKPTRVAIYVCVLYTRYSILANFTELYSSIGFLFDKYAVVVEKQLHRLSCHYEHASFANESEEVLFCRFCVLCARVSNGEIPRIVEHGGGSDGMHTHICMVSLKSDTGILVSMLPCQHKNTIRLSKNQIQMPIYFLWLPINRWKNQQTVPYVASIDSLESISADKKHMDSSNFIFCFSFHLLGSEKEKNYEVEKIMSAECI